MFGPVHACLASAKVNYLEGDTGNTTGRRWVNGLIKELKELSPVVRFVIHGQIYHCYCLLKAAPIVVFCSGLDYADWYMIIIPK